MTKIVSCPGLGYQTQHRKKIDNLYKVLINYPKGEYTKTPLRDSLRQNLIAVLSIKGLLNLAVIFRHNNYEPNNEISLTPVEQLVYMSDNNQSQSQPRYDIIKRCSSCLLAKFTESFSNIEPNINIIRDIYNLFKNWSMHVTYLEVGILDKDWHRNTVNYKNTVEYLNEIIGNNELVDKLRQYKEI